MVTVFCHTKRWFTLVLLLCLPLAGLAQEPRKEAYIELSASADEVYVQQQLRLTVKLYYTNQVVQGQLSDPEHPDAVIEKLGEQKQYRETVDGERYRVVERDYVIFPQTPGPLQLPPVDFQGTARHPQGHHYRIDDSAVLFAVNVRDIPQGFSGRTWLPASDLTINARGLERTQTVAPGDNLTRTLTLVAEGLPATTLPALDIPYPESIRSYPEPADRQTRAGAGGVIGELQQTTALVPVTGHGGDIVLPEVRIPWWDVEEDREKVAVLPARTLRLATAPGTEPANTPPPRDQAVQEAGDGETAMDGVAGRGHWAWPLLTGALVLGWATTLVAWWLQARKSRRVAPARPEASDRKTFERLQHQARTLDPAFFNDFPRWAGALTGRTCTNTDQALALLGQRSLTDAVTQWRRSLFGPEGVSPPDGAGLASALGEARKRWQSRGATPGATSVLPNLYPDGLKP